ncbi:MAG TPA: hypothetical protein VE263_22075 [Candidatus Angelobacter sp.]|nr:hypothetical protein [Candidatus Angelobacter sp.]
MRYRYVLRAVLAAAFLFPPTTRAQSAPVLTDANATLLPGEKKEVSVSPEISSPIPKYVRPSVSLPAQTRFHRRQFVALSVAVYAAASADMYQTLQVRHYSWWSETDPLARPFVKLPAPAYYATGLALATGVNWLSWKMSHSRKWHKLAPLPQLLAIAGNTYGFKSNRYQNY